MPDCYEALFPKYAFNPISSFESTFNSPYASHEQGQWTFISLNLLFPWSVSSSYAYIWEILWFRFLYFVCVKPLPCYHVDPLMRHLAISSLGNGIDGKHTAPPLAGGGGAVWQIFWGDFAAVVVTTPRSFVVIKTLFSRKLTQTNNTGFFKIVSPLRIEVWVDLKEKKTFKKIPIDIFS